MLTLSCCKSYYKGRRVLVTGHTGFKGAWLCEWLLSLGAQVHGFALPPPTRPSLFNQLKLAKRLASHAIGDVRDLAAVTAAMRRVKPDFVFHLAAQPLVRLSYEKPVETFDTNVMGTIHVLEAARRVFGAGAARRRVSRGGIIQFPEAGFLRYLASGQGPQGQRVRRHARHNFRQQAV